MQLRFILRDEGFLGGLRKILAYRILLVFLLGATLGSGRAAAQLVDYTFAGGTGTNSGSLGSSANLTLAGGASYVTSPALNSGDSLDVYAGGNGEANYAGTSSVVSGLADVGSTFTIAMWVNLAAAPSVSATDRLLSTLSSSQSGGIDLSFEPGGTASNFALTLSVNSSTASGDSVNSVSGYSASNQWEFVAVTFDAGTVQFYVGNTTTTAQALGSALSTTPTSVNSTGEGALEIGGTAASAGDRTPPGYFDDVEVFGSALTASQVDAIQFQAVPEPRSTTLLVIGLCFLAIPLLYRRRWFIPA